MGFFYHFYNLLGAPKQVPVPIGALSACMITAKLADFQMRMHESFLLGLAVYGILFTAGVLCILLTHESVSSWHWRRMWSLVRRILSMP
jgi:hypothetical protein